ncbi:MAG: DUF2309 family protein [Deltaproteobacteria bacterium]|nr:DUF2309 family protein [Deltaproteobacteria bacterium]
MSHVINEALEKAKNFLPEQGPLDFFVHHNTIHQFEHDEFFEGTRKAAIKYNTRDFLNLSEYQNHFQNNRISQKDLLESIYYFLKKQTLPETLAEPLLSFLQQDPHSDENKNNAQSELPQDVCPSAPIIKHLFLKEYSSRFFDEDIDSYFSPTFLKFMASYFDFGASYWKMEDRSLGIWTCFKSIYSKSIFLESRFHRNLSGFLKENSDKNAEAILLKISQELSLKDNQIHEYLFNTLYRYKGWSALVKSLEEHPDWNKSKDIKPDFTEFAAVLMALEFVAYKTIAGSHQACIPLVQKNDPYQDKLVLLAHQFFSDKVDKTNLKNLLSHLTVSHCKEIWHYAYERNLYHRFLSTYKHGLEHVKAPTQKSKYQAFFCIDDREESLRRYLEQLDPECETFGVAGHFNLPIKFKGVFDKHSRALCPVSVAPDKIIEEVLEDSKKPTSLSLYGELLWLSAVSSKTFTRGVFQSFFSGFLNLAPFALDIFSPETSAQIKEFVSKKVKANVKTTFSYKHPENQKGFTLEERIQIANGVLTATGLVKDFSPFVFFIGHGSSSLNNPHEAAHDCGACGGGRGWPNGRLIALILNETEVRAGLANLGIAIPDSTQFIGGYHNTCSDELEFYDLPDSEALKKHLKSLYKAAEWDAKERCRRFIEVNRTKDNYRYAKGRALDFSQPRPEYGHATNTFCVVGPRQYTKPLFLDRRAFLVSYDHKTDPAGQVLNAILQAVGPVCSGINLEYYYSFIDNEKFGCGTKLPHNVTSLLGVSNGFQSDLQLGLPWQMVEIHEPTRLLMLIICRKNTMEDLLRASGGFQNLVKNRWVELSVHDPEDGKIYWFQHGQLQEFTARTTPSRYKNFDTDIFKTAEHLDFGIYSASTEE